MACAHVAQNASRPDIMDVAKKTGMNLELPVCKHMSNVFKCHMPIPCAGYPALQFSPQKWSLKHSTRSEANLSISTSVS